MMNFNRSFCSVLILIAVLRFWPVSFVSAAANWRIDQSRLCAECGCSFGQKFSEACRSLGSNRPKRFVHAQVSKDTSSTENGPRFDI